jgi:hypothetical protein
MKGAAKLPYTAVAYPKEVQTDKQVGAAWQSLRNEMKISEYCRRVGLAREEVGTVTHAPTGKTFVQWRHAIPTALATKELK